MGWWFTSPRPYGMVHGVETILTKSGMSWFIHCSGRYGWIRPSAQISSIGAYSRTGSVAYAGALGETCLFLYVPNTGFGSIRVRLRSSESHGSGLLGATGSSEWSVTLPRRPRTTASIRWLGCSFRVGSSLGETATTADDGCVHLDYRRTARRYTLATAGGITTVYRLCRTVVFPL